MDIDDHKRRKPRCAPGSKPRRVGVLTRSLTRSGQCTAAGGSFPLPRRSSLRSSLPRIKLTERELEVLTLMAKGMSNKDLAETIGRTEE